MRFDDSTRVSRYVFDRSTARCGDVAGGMKIEGMPV